MYLNTQHSKCIVLQYNFQQYTFILLQYNSLAYLQASLQYNSLYCNTIFQPLSPPIAIHFLSQKDYIAIQSVNHQAPLLQYNSHPISLLLQYKTKPTTLPRLQYNFPIAIQSQPNYILLLQYNCNTNFFSSPLSCNTIARLQYKTKKISQDNWAVAQKRLCTKFFFFNIIYFYIFSIISRNWKKTLESLKIIFFHTLYYSNKFIKIYLTPFS